MGEREASMAITDPRLREIVQALGDGGTMEMGERVLAWMDRSARYAFSSSRRGTRIVN